MSGLVAQTIREIVKAKSIPPVIKYRNISYLPNISYLSKGAEFGENSPENQ
jgi:hypothetical protein